MINSSAGMYAFNLQNGKKLIPQTKTDFKTLYLFAQ